MAEKRYFWLKLYDDFFTSKRIKKLRSIAGGDTYTIIYLKMQLKALKTEGYLYFDGVMNDFAEELALDLDEKPDDVKVAINYLMSVGLLETNDGEQYKLPFLDRCIGSETASAQRLRDYRARKKDEIALHCNASVTEVKQVGNVEKRREDIEIEIDKDIDKDIMPSNADEIIRYLNEKAGTHYRDSKETVRLINARTKDGFTVDDFKKVIDKKVKEWKGTEQAQYIRPSTLFAPSHFEEYLNAPDKGKYKPLQNSQLHHMMKADYDIEALERKLIKN